MTTPVGKRFTHPDLLHWTPQMPAAGAKRGVWLDETLKPDIKIYRYSSAEKLLRTLRERKVYLANVVDSWTDPYESWWCKQLFRPGSKLHDVHVYGNCWTTVARDEPFWRLYEDRCPRCKSAGHPPHDPPVRVRAKPMTLVDVSKTAIANSSFDAKVYLGAVQYRPQPHIMASCEAFRSNGKQVSATAASGLHLKREAFQYESEVRLLWIDRESPRPGKLIDFDPVTVYEQIMIGPGADDGTFTRMRDSIVALGYPIDRVVRSVIYRPPPAP